MKNLFLLTAFFALSINICAQDNSQDLSAKDLKKYPLKGAIIKYSITGDATGSATRTFSNDGWLDHFVTEIEINKYGISDNTITSTLSLGDYTYSFKNKDTKGTKLKDSRYSELLRYKTANESIEAIMQAEGATKSGTSIILDKTCTKWIFSTGVVKEIYEWEGLVLKIVKHLPGINYEILAIEINETPTMDSTIFNIPTGITFN
jgi:hypothetical protein